MFENYFKLKFLKSIISILIKQLLRIFFAKAIHKILSNDLVVKPLEMPTKIVSLTTILAIIITIDPVSCQKKQRQYWICKSKKHSSTLTAISQSIYERVMQLRGENKT